MIRDEEPGVGIYRLHVWLRQISPMIWRRLLVRSDSTTTDLHYILQIAFGWSDEHLNRFHIHGQDDGVYHDGGIGFSTDPEHVQLGDFRFRVNERFLYEYDLNDGWEHQVRVEARLGAGGETHLSVLHRWQAPSAARGLRRPACLRDPP